MQRLQRYLKTHPEENWNGAAIAQLSSLDYLEKHFPEVAASLIAELEAQRNSLKLIASENYSSLAVQLAMGNWMTDKYAEGYPFHRFYAGCENVDAVESRASSLACQLFGSEYAYVQPHSGADANLLAYWAVLVKKVQEGHLAKMGIKNVDQLNKEEHENLRKELLSKKLLGLSLNSGGHLTHGYRHNISSKIFQSSFYEVDPKTERIDYSALRKQALEEKPLILLAGYSSHPRKLNFAKFKEIADEVGAVLIVDMAHFSGLVAGKAFSGEYDPIPYADIVTTTTHKTLRGPRGGMILAKSEFAESLNKGCPLVLGGPLPHVMAAKAIAFEEALSNDFRDYSKQILINAETLGTALQSHGVRLVTGGTDNHMVVADISSFGITGRHAEKALSSAGFAVNRNAIPFDKQGPWYTSGIRIGTPAVTTRGMKEEEMRKIAGWIYDVLKATRPKKTVSGAESRAECDVEENVLKRVRAQIQELLVSFPLYPELGNVLLEEPV